jgi:TonB family protein
LKLYHAVNISILLHLALVLGLRVADYKFKVEEKVPKQYVEFREDNKRTPIPGEKTKRVKKETRVRDTSPTTITAPVEPHPLSHPTKQMADENNNSIGEKLRSLSPSPSDVFMRSSNTTSNFRQQLQSFLPRDLEIGDVVALNADQNLFFTFYNRMAQKIVYPWALNVVAGFEKMKSQGQLGSTRKAWITTIEVILDKNGTVISTQPLQLAGDWDIDNAPLKAFKQAKNFPNPPAEMVEEDGYIHIRYRFLVYYNPM